MKIVALIPSRLNSERVPGKNVKPLGGIPLVNYTLRVLNKVDLLTDIVLFASETKILDYLEKDLKCNFVQRPVILDNQQTSIQDILNEFLKVYSDVDVIVLWHITSPFLCAETVIDCVGKVHSGLYDSAFTAYSFNKFAWYKGDPLNYSLDKPTPRTQDINPIILEQSSLYVFSKELFQKTGRRIGYNPYIKVIDHFEGHDIDTPEDFEIAELMVNSGFFNLRG